MSAFNEGGMRAAARQYHLDRKRNRPRGFGLKLRGQDFFAGGLVRENYPHIAKGSSRGRSKPGMTVSLVARRRYNNFLFW
jgi:hypothetical protein